MKYSVIITQTAFDDLDTIKNYISVSDESNGNKYVSSLLDRLEKLDLFPYRGRKIANKVFDYAKAYYLICLNHIAIYTINENAKCVYILAILSHYQEWRKIIEKDSKEKTEVITKNDRISLAKLNYLMSYDIYKNSNDLNTQKYLPDEVFLSLEDASDRVSSLCDCYKNNDGPFVYAVIRNKDLLNIGYVQLLFNGKDWEIGYHIAEPFTNCGYATEALKLFMSYINKNTEIKTIHATVLSLNKASVRVLEKCDFEFYFDGGGTYQGKRRKIKHGKYTFNTRL